MELESENWLFSGELDVCVVSALTTFAYLLIHPLMLSHPHTINRAPHHQSIMKKFAWWPLRKLSKARTTPDITAESDASDDEGITSTEAGGALEHSSPDVDDTLSVSGTRREEVDRSADVPTNGASNNTSKLFVEVDEGARQEEVVIVMEVQNSDDENEDGLTKPLLDASAPRS